MNINSVFNNFYNSKAWDNLADKAATIGCTVYTELRQIPVHMHTYTFAKVAYPTIALNIFSMAVAQPLAAYVEKKSKSYLGGDLTYSVALASAGFAFRHLTGFTSAASGLAVVASAVAGFALHYFYLGGRATDKHKLSVSTPPPIDTVGEQTNGEVKFTHHLTLVTYGIGDKEPWILYSAGKPESDQNWQRVKFKKLNERQFEVNLDMIKGDNLEYKIFMGAKDHDYSSSTDYPGATWQKTSDNGNVKIDASLPFSTEEDTERNIRDDQCVDPEWQN